MWTNHHLYIPGDPMQNPVASDLNTTKPRDIYIPCKQKLAMDGQCDFWQAIRLHLWLPSHWVVLPTPRWEAHEGNCKRAKRSDRRALVN